MPTNFMAWIATASIVLVAGSPSHAGDADHTQRTYDAGYEETWQASLQALTTDLKLSIKTLEKSSGLIQVESQGGLGSEWGEANELVEKFTTKKVKAFSLWSGLLIECNLLLVASGKEQTGVTINTSMNGFAGWKEEWVPLESNGSFEKTVFEAIDKRLGARTGGPVKPAQGAPSTVAPVAAAAEHGTIELSSKPPRADVEVDGNFVGQTPAKLRLAPGKHLIKLTKKGYGEWARELQVLAGSSLHLEAELEKP